MRNGWLNYLEERRLEEKKIFQRKGMTSCLFNSQSTTGKNERKYRHMFVIPFPVCAYAAIHYRQIRQMDDTII